MRCMLIGQRWPMPCCMHSMSALCRLPGGLARQQMHLRRPLTDVASRRCHSGSPLSGRFCRMSRMLSSSTAGHTAEAEAPTGISGKPEVSSNGAGREAAVLTFQEAIARLQSYWASVGCAVWQPFNSEVHGSSARGTHIFVRSRPVREHSDGPEKFYRRMASPLDSCNRLQQQVGAGTMNPATFLRVLGPEKWSVCYVEPSVRPDDSRYGENPNRLQQHTQFQVILKPDPGRPQELYLGSLEALGIDTSAHDVRFVEDNWENPTLGAWGLGWEVWMDGQEVTQYTYFQQAAGLSLPVPSVEITYGLERIMTALQGVKHFKDIQYTPSLTYGELLLQNEYEMSCYNMDQAEVAIQQQMFKLHEEEAMRLVKAGLPIPAYVQLLKLSHCFNVLDARGAVGVTLRAACFGAMRMLAKQIAGLWLKRREELEFPLGIASDVRTPGPARPQGVLSSEPADLVVEIGCEELPPADATSAVAQLRQAVPQLLKKLQLSHGQVTVESTPRRLGIIIAAVQARQVDVEESVRGPPAKIAYDKDGQPTKALSGFAAKNGVDLADCTKEADAKGVEYVWAVRKQKGRHAAEVLTEELGGLVGSLSFTQSMRWNGGTAFSRPVRWLLALHGSTILPFSFAGLQAGRSTQGLRNSPNSHDFSSTVEIASASDYSAALEAAQILMGVQQRSEVIWRDTLSAAAEVGGTVPESARGDLLHEVTHLVESPRVLRGSFDADFLKLPREVLVMVMRKHQRYFPVYSQHGEELMPYFITVANGAIHPPTVISGNEAVLQARFEDAQFFYMSDMRPPLEAFIPNLEGTQFHRSLGNLLQKTERVQQLIAPLAEACDLSDARATAEAAARLSRADLATSLVTEMTGLAGTMGRHYALQSGVAPDIAEAVFEAVLPRQSGGAIPRAPAGVLVSVADRLDSLVGLWAAGEAPRASADPFGLRRSAYGMLEALTGNNISLDLGEAAAHAARLQPIPVSREALEGVLEFVTRRLEQLLVDEGCGVEVVKAVLSERGANPSIAAQSARELQRLVKEGESGLLPAVMEAYARPTRIVRGKDVRAEWGVDEGLFEMEEERALWAAFLAAQDAVGPAVGVREFFEVSQGLVAPTAAYFDKVFVMSEDDAVRQNRLALLRDIAALPKGIINFAQLPGF